MPSKGKTKAMSKAKAKSLKGGRRVAYDKGLGLKPGNKAQQEFGHFGKGGEAPWGNKAQQEFGVKPGLKGDPSSGTKR